jgi:hypothetical protein
VVSGAPVLSAAKRGRRKAVERLERLELAAEWVSVLNVLNGNLGYMPIV